MPSGIEEKFIDFSYAQCSSIYVIRNTFSWPVKFGINAELGMKILSGQFVAGAVLSQCTYYDVIILCPVIRSHTITQN